MDFLVVFSRIITLLLMIDVREVKFSIMENYNDYFSKKKLNVCRFIKIYDSDSIR